MRKTEAIDIDCTLGDSSGVSVSAYTHFRSDGRIDMYPERINLIDQGAVFGLIARCK